MSAAELGAKARALLRGSQRATLATLLDGAPYASLVLVAEDEDAAPILTAVDVGILAAVSSLRPRERSPASRMWQASFGRAENLHGRPLWQDYRILGAGLLALTAAIVVIFR